MYARCQNGVGAVALENNEGPHLTILGTTVGLSCPKGGTVQNSFRVYPEEGQINPRFGVIAFAVGDAFWNNGAVIPVRWDEQGKLFIGSCDGQFQSFTLTSAMLLTRRRWQIYCHGVSTWLEVATSRGRYSANEASETAKWYIGGSQLCRYLAEEIGEEELHNVALPIQR